jgi:formate hydrogenlyase subunit 3/multisubunit Na+/H+ antiporter MnhD subunit
MNALLAIPVIVPLIAAALTVIAARRPMLQRIVTVAGVSTALAAAIAILVQVDQHGPQANERPVPAVGQVSAAHRPRQQRGDQPVRTALPAGGPPFKPAGRGSGQ